MQKQKACSNSTQLSEPARSDFKQHNMSNGIWRFQAPRDEVSLKWFACGKQLFLDTRDVSRWEELWKRAIISVIISRHTGSGLRVRTDMKTWQTRIASTNTSGAFGFTSVLLVFQETRATLTKIWMNFSLVYMQIWCSQCLWKLWKLPWAVVFCSTYE